MNKSRSSLESLSTLVREYEAQARRRAGDLSAKASQDGFASSDVVLHKKLELPYKLGSVRLIYVYTVFGYTKHMAQS